jgi:hypothetical protein
MRSEPAWDLKSPFERRGGLGRKLALGLFPAGLFRSVGTAALWSRVVPIAGDSRFRVLSGWERQHSAPAFWGDRAESASPIAGKSAWHRGLSDQGLVAEMFPDEYRADRRSIRSLTRMAARDPIKLA